MLRLIGHVNTVLCSVSYVVYDDISKDCIIIDVGDSEKIMEIIAPFNLNAILLTHVHYDNIYGLNDLKSRYPKVLIYTNEFGLESLYNSSDNLSSYHGHKMMLDSNAKVYVLNGEDKIVVNNICISAFATPGHDWSCMCYSIGKWLFTGDAYIPGKKVFTKFQNGSYEDSVISLRKIKNNAKDMIICPGHK